MKCAEYFVLFCRSTGPHDDRGLERQMEAEGLKGAWCISECRVKFPGPFGEMKGASVWKWWELQLPLQRRPTVLWRYLNVELLLPSVRCTEGVAPRLTALGFSSSWLLRSEDGEKKRARLQESVTGLSPRRRSNESAKPHYWWHIILSQFGQMLHIKRKEITQWLTVMWMKGAMLLLVFTCKGSFTYLCTKKKTQCLEFFISEDTSARIWETNERRLPTEGSICFGIHIQHWA